MIFGFIFSAICSVVSTVSSFVATVGSIVLKAIDVVSNVISGLGKLFEVLKPDEQIEDLGDRVLQAGEEGIKPEQFSKYDEYLDAIRNFELDPDKSSKITPADKKMAGIATTCKAIEEKFDMQSGVMNSFAAMIAMDKNYFTQDRLAQWLSSPELDKGKLVDMFNHKLTSREAYEMENQLIDVEKRLNPEKSEQTIEAELMSAQRNIDQGADISSNPEKSGS